MSIFGDNLKVLRSNNKITMAELAQKVGTTKSSVSMWENSGVIPRNEVLKNISKYFGVSIDYLLGNERLEGVKPENVQLEYLRRNLEKLDADKLKKAEEVLKVVFSDIFEDDEDHGDI